jgi:hypothetical protein
MSVNKIVKWKNVVSFVQILKIVYFLLFQIINTTIINKVANVLSFYIYLIDVTVIFFVIWTNNAVEHKILYATRP